MPFYDISLTEIRKNVERRKKRYIGDRSNCFDDNEYSIGIIKEVKNNFGEILTRLMGIYK